MNKCPDCQGDLEKGVILDQTYGAVTAQRYARAEIADGNQKLFGVVEDKFSDIRRVVALRCLKCNRVFLYAQNTVLIPNLNTKVKTRILVIIGIMVLVVILGLGLSSF